MAPPFFVKSGLFQCAVLAIVLLSATPASATHFRYGQLSWQRITGVGVPANTVRLDLFAAFRRDGYGGTAPDGRPAIGNIITETIGGTGINFGDGTSTGTLRFLVLNIDPVNNWIYAVALAPGTNNQGVLHTYTSPGPWTANVNACCRISNSVNAPDSPYSVQTIINLATTNVSPTSTLPIIVQCPAAQSCNFAVPAADPDAQLLQYRVASVSESQIAPLSGLAVTSVGDATFQTPNNVGGLYSAQIVIEKRDRFNQTNLLTRIGVDFLIQVVQAGPPPSFQSPTPACGQTINLQVGQPVQFTVSARSNNVGGSVTLNATGQPAGSAFTPPLPVSGSPSVSSQFNFTPSAAQGGQLFLMNMTATDEGGRQALCGFAIQVIAPNTVVRLNATRSGTRVRLQWLVSGQLCGVPTYQLFKLVGGGTTVMLLSTPATAAQDILVGPAGTVNEYRVDMVFLDNCAPPTRSNVVGIAF